MPTISPPATELMVRLPLSESILKQYREEAAQYGVDLEELLANRLAECVTFRASKPLYFDDEQRREIEKMLGRNLAGPGTLIGLIRNLISIKINGLQVTLKPDILGRLRTRHNAGTFSDWLGKQVAQWAAQYVGLG